MAIRLASVSCFCLRSEVRHAAAPILAKWEKHLGVVTQQTFVQRMKTKGDIILDGITPKMLGRNLCRRRLKYRFRKA
jgi:hypothetical protein